MTSLCFDNWERIASHLDLCGLINITEISSDARAAAQLLFKRRFSSHYFRLNWTHDRQIGIETISMRQSNKLLQHFGHFIFKLDINLAPNATVYNNMDLQNVFRNINQYCTRNCHRLQLGSYFPFLINEPLRNVDELNICTGDYSLHEFSAMFGNIRTLEISSKEACIYLKQRMRQLKRLCIADSIYNNGDDGIQDSDIVDAIALNPQIDRLEIFNDGAFEITRNNGAELELIMEWDAKDLLFKLIQPEHIEGLDLIYGYEIGEFGEFIRKFINLKCLTLDTCHDELFDVIDALPKLQELHICFEKFDYDAEEFEDIEWFLSTIKVHEKLSVFSFHFEDEKNRQIFQQIFQAVNDFVWNISIIDNADGPYGYKYSVVLNTIRSVSNELIEK